MSNVDAIGIDEKHIGRGRVVTVVHDVSGATRGRVLHLSEGCRAENVGVSVEALRAHARRSRSRRALQHGHGQELHRRRARAPAASVAMLRSVPPDQARQRGRGCSAAGGSRERAGAQAHPLPLAQGRRRLERARSRSALAASFRPQDGSRLAPERASARHSRLAATSRRFLCWGVRGRLDPLGAALLGCPRSSVWARPFRPISMASAACSSMPTQTLLRSPSMPISKAPLPAPEASAPSATSVTDVYLLKARLDFLPGPPRFGSRVHEIDVRRIHTEQDGPAFCNTALEFGNRCITSSSRYSCFWRSFVR